MFRNKNRHSLQPAVKKQFSMNAEDFPDIIPSETATRNDDAKSQKSVVAVEMDFKNCYKPPPPAVSVENNRTPEWLYGFGENNPHKIWFENYKHEVVEIDKIPNINDESPSVEELLADYCREWEKYKEEYIELNGYEDFEKTFISLRMNYDEDNYETDYEEEEVEDDADELYDEYGDPYDDPYYYK
jgi:hypothetical protein